MHGHVQASFRDVAHRPIYHSLRSDSLHGYNLWRLVKVKWIPINSNAEMQTVTVRQQVIAPQKMHIWAKYGHTWRDIVKQGGLMNGHHSQCCGEIIIWQVVRWKLIFNKWLQIDFAGETIAGQSSDSRQQETMYMSQRNLYKSIKWWNGRILYLPYAACRTSYNVRVSVAVWIQSERIFIQTLFVCNISACKETRNHSFQSHKAHMVRKVWRRSSTPASTLVTIITLTSAGDGVLQSLKRTNDALQLCKDLLAPLVSTWLWLCCGINQLLIGWRNYYGKSRRSLTQVWLIRSCSRQQLI